MILIMLNGAFYKKILLSYIICDTIFNIMCILLNCMDNINHTKVLSLETLVIRYANKRVVFCISPEVHNHLIDKRQWLKLSNQSYLNNIFSICITKKENNLLLFSFDLFDYKTILLL